MGGGGKGGSSTQTVTIPPEVLARYNSVNARAEETAKIPFQEYSQDPSAFVAQLNQTQQAGVAGASQYANAAQPYYQQAADYTKQGAGAANPMALDQGAIDKYMSPYLNNVVGTTMANLRQQQGQEQSGLMGGAAMSGAFGGDRAGIAQANLAKQQNMATGSTLANILQQGYGQALQTAQQQQGIDLGAQQANLARLTGAGAQMGAIGTGSQAAGLAGAQSQLAAGQIGQQTEQAGKSAMYNQFLQKQGYPFQVTQFLANVATGTGALTGSTTNTTQASDRRLKHDIKEIGETHDGEPLYAFKYKGDDTTHYGPMAQNVEERHPENVGLAGGYKTVDYDAVADRAAEAGEKQHAAHGGQIHSEGGVVLPFRAREGFATSGGVGVTNPGVAAGFDPDFIKALLADREGKYAAMYGQPGVPFGAQGNPGSKGVVPAPMGVAKPLTPAAPPPRQQSSTDSAMATGSKIASLYGAGKQVKSDYESWQKDRAEKAALEKAALEKAAAEKPAAAVAGDQRAEANVPLPPARPTNLAEAQPASETPQPPARPKNLAEAQPAADSQLVQQASLVSDQQQPSDPNPQLEVPEQVADLGSDLDLGDSFGSFEPSMFAARGGVIAGKRNGYASKGFVTPGYDPEMKATDIIDQVVDEGEKESKDDVSEFNSMKPKGLPKQEKDKTGQTIGGLAGNILGSIVGGPIGGAIGSTAGSYLGSQFASGGMAEGRQHFSRGGLGLEDLTRNTLLDTPVDPENPDQPQMAKAEDLGLGRIQMAKVDTNTATDAGGVAPRPPANIPDQKKVEAPAVELDKTKPMEAPQPATGTLKPRLKQDEISSPFLAAANKLAPDLPGFLKSENFLIPALATLATGLSSRAPTRTQGLGEAIAGGVGAYTGLRGQNAQIAETEARTEKTFADIVKDNIYEVGGRMQFRYLKPDGTWGSMSQIDYLRMPPEDRNKIQFDPRISGAMPQILAGSSSAQGDGTGAGAGTNARAGTGTGVAAGANRTVQTTPRPIEGTEIQPDSEAMAMSRQNHEAIVQGGRQRAEQEPDFYTPQKEIADASLNVRPTLTTLAGSLSSLPRDKSILASGKVQEVLNPVAQYMNGLLRVMGLPEAANAEDLANTQSAMKSVAQYQDRAASDAGRRAYAAYEALAKTIPTTLNDPRAQGKLLSTMYQANQIELDKQRYFDSMRRHAETFDPVTALKTGRSANEAFNKKYNAEFYSNEKKNLEAMFGTPLIGMKDPRTGRDMTVMQLLTTNPGSLDKEYKDQIIAKFGGDPKILRYFNISYP
jgi:hypothetical protein